MTPVRRKRGCKPRFQPIEPRCFLCRHSSPLRVFLSLRQKNELFMIKTQHELRHFALHPMLFDQKRSSTLSESRASTLKDLIQDEIVSGAIEFGERLPIAALAARYGSSTTCRCARRCGPLPARGLWWRKQTRARAWSPSRPAGPACLCRAGGVGSCWRERLRSGSPERH